MRTEQELIAAVRAGNTEEVRKLLTGPSAISPDTKDGETPVLYIAAQRGDHETVKVLCAAGANKDLRGRDGFAPLHIAAYKNFPKVVRILCAAGANKDLTLPDGATALFIAAAWGHTDVVRILCAAGASIDIRTKLGTPKDIAHQRGYQTIEVLLSKTSRSNPNSAPAPPPDLFPVTPEMEHNLILSVRGGYAGRVEQLVTAPFYVSPDTKDGETPILCIAAQRGDHKTVKVLCKNGANVNCATPDGVTPLRLAAQNGHKEVVKLLYFAFATIDHASIESARDNNHQVIADFLRIPPPRRKTQPPPAVSVTGAPSLSLSHSPVSSSQPQEVLAAPPPLPKPQGAATPRSPAALWQRSFQLTQKMGGEVAENLEQKYTDKEGHTYIPLKIVTASHPR